MLETEGAAGERYRCLVMSLVAGNRTPRANPHSCHRQLTIRISSAVLQRRSQCADTDQQRNRCKQSCLDELSKHLVITQCVTWQFRMTKSVEVSIVVMPKIADEEQFSKSSVEIACWQLVPI